MKLQGSIAYVAQQAWIQNATVKDNILFGKPLNQCVYMDTIKNCELVSDFDVLPGGDMTEIGEKVRHGWEMLLLEFHPGGTITCAEHCSITASALTVVQMCMHMDLI